MWDYEDNSVFLHPEFTTLHHHLYELERASYHVGKSIFSGWRKYHSGCKEVTSPTLPLGSADLLTAVSTSVEPSGNTLLSYNYNPFSRITIHPIVVQS